MFARPDLIINQYGVVLQNFQWQLHMLVMNNMEFGTQVI